MPGSPPSYAIDTVQVSGQEKHLVVSAGVPRVGLACAHGALPKRGPRTQPCAPLSPSRLAVRGGCGQPAGRLERGRLL